MLIAFFDRFETRLTFVQFQIDMTKQNFLNRSIWFKTSINFSNFRFIETNAKTFDSFYNTFSVILSMTKFLICSFYFVQKLLSVSMHDVKNFQSSFCENNAAKLERSTFFIDQSKIAARISNVSEFISRRNHSLKISDADANRAQRRFATVFQFLQKNIIRKKFKIIYFSLSCFWTQCEIVLSNFNRRWLRQNTLTCVQIAKNCEIPNFWQLKFQMIWNLKN